MTNKQFDYNEIIGRQANQQHPLMTVFIDLLTRFDEAKSLLTEFNTDEDGSTVSLELDKWLNDCTGYTLQMAQAGLFHNLILKIQRPLESNDPKIKEAGACLVYDKDARICQTMTIDEPANSWFGADPKMYVTARLWIDGTLQLISRVEDQPW